MYCSSNAFFFIMSVTWEASPHQRITSPVFVDVSSSSQPSVESVSDDGVMALLGGSQSSTDRVAASSSSTLTKIQAFRIRQEIESGMTGSGHKRRSLTAVELEQKQHALSMYKNSLTYGRAQEVVEHITDTVHERADITDQKIENLQLTIVGRNPNKGSSSVVKVYAQNDAALALLRSEQRVCKLFMKRSPTMLFGEAVQRVEVMESNQAAGPSADVVPVEALDSSSDDVVGNEAASTEQPPKRRKTTSGNPIGEQYHCACGKVCVSSRGLTQHKKSCKTVVEEVGEDVD